MLSTKLQLVVGGVVTVVWVINFGAQFVVAGYEPDPQVHAVFTLVLGALFALGSKKSNNGEGGSGSGGGGNGGQ